MKGSEAGQHLAELVIASVCEAIGRPVRSANPGDYFVIRESPAPSVLVECGFLSNPEELQKLRARMPHTFLLVPGYGALGCSPILRKPPAPARAQGKAQR